MYVRMKDGAYCGEVRELQFQTARELIAAGRAEKFDFDSPNESPRDTAHLPVAAATPELPKKGRRRLTHA